MASEYKTDKSIKGIEATKEIYPMVKKLYESAWRAKEEGKKVAYTSAFYPGEILRAMDIIHLQPESFSAACAAKQISPQAIEVAEAKGYSIEMCSYLKCHMGYVFEAEKLPRPPGGGMPPPDFTLGTEHTCTTQVKWMRVLAKYYDVPCYIVHFPIKPSRMFGKKIEDHYMEFAIAQLKDLVRFLEEQTGTKLDMDRLKETIRNSHIASMLYDQCYEYRRSVPCPAGAEDFSSTMMPVVWLMGSKEAVDFYERLSNQILEKVRRGEGSLSQERFRLLYEGIPPWYTLGFYNYFDKFGAVIAYEYYNTRELTRPMDPAKPWESLALKYMDFFNHWSFTERADAILRAAREYRIDGAILGHNMSCRSYCCHIWYLKDRLEKEVGIPSMILDYDHSDPRRYADAAVKNRIDAFMEMLEERKEE